MDMFSFKGILRVVKKIVVISFFVTCATFFLITCTYIFRRNGENSKQRFAGFYYQDDKSIDVIYIGASPVYIYWAAPLAWHEYGFTSWPLASSTQQPCAAIYLLKEAWKTQRPKVIIVELRMFTFTQEAFNSNNDWEGTTRFLTDDLKYSNNRFQLISQLLSIPQEHHYSFYFDIAKYHSLWKDLKEPDYECWDFETADMLGGHYLKSEVADLSENYYDFRSINSTQAIPTEQEETLRGLLSYCKKNNMTVLFTINPYTDFTEEKQKMFNYMSNIVINEYNYDFINFNNLFDELGINLEADFYDGGHVNTRGAVKFTRYLANYLVDNYDLKDKRGDVEYSDEWNAMYKSWKVNADQAIATIEQKVKEGNYDE